MTIKQFLLLLIPSMLWGSSFIFFKELSPIFGPFLTSTVRILFAAFFMFLFFVFTKRSLKKKDIKKLFIIGVMNSAIPFTLYAYAALYIPSSLSVILNSTSPIFGAMLGVFILHEKMSWNKYFGLLVGFVGVSIVSSFVFIEMDVLMILSIGACLLAAFMYGLAGVYVKKYASDIDSYSLTYGSLLFAGLTMLVLYLFLIPFHIHPPVITEGLVLNIILLILFGILCTSIPYIIYYKLIKEIGPVKALTVTYLMPIFGIVWSLLYGEEFRISMIFGLVIVLLGIYILGYKKEEA